MKRLVALPCLALALCLTARADRPASPFTITPGLTATAGGATVRLQFFVPPEHVLYAERLKFQNEDGDAFTPSKMPDPVVAHDKSDGHEKRMFTQPFAAEVPLPCLPTNLIIKFQGCSNSACYFPEKRSFRVTASGVTDADAAPVAGEVAKSSEEWRKEVSQFTVAAKQTGYVKSGDFLSFLRRAQSGEAEGDSDDPVARFKRLGLATTLLVIVLGGLGLNLTPCVLPMIPINLAIIGAGSKAGSRKRGFMLGGFYGAGMALAYGALGVVVVMTGAKFGTLNSSPWFNFIIALVFIVLSLGMFDVINIDPSRIQFGMKRSSKGGAGQSIAAFSLGVFAALLAGACVAPVVISVVLLAAHLYGKGMVIGLALPFLLGLGMALPWPFAGAGMKFLPKPGRWMKWVKVGFGVLILVFAGYYGKLGVGIMTRQNMETSLASAPTQANAATGGANQELAQALHRAQLENRPVFIDFAASWCKNCVAMDETVFNQKAVKDRLGDFIVVRYEAEKPNEGPAKLVLDHFQVIGLPTYLVLMPNRSSAGATNRSAQKISALPNPTKSAL